jgi:hypothetical protein
VIGLYRFTSGYRSDEIQCVCVSDAINLRVLAVTIFCGAVPSTTLSKSGIQFNTIIINMDGALF